MDFTQVFIATTVSVSIVFILYYKIGFKEIKDCGVGGGFQHHIFTEEEDYYEDLSKSWFGLTCGYIFLL